MPFESRHIPDFCALLDSLLPAPRWAACSECEEPGVVTFVKRPVAENLVLPLGLLAKLYEPLGADARPQIADGALRISVPMGGFDLETRRTALASDYAVRSFRLVTDAAAKKCGLRGETPAEEVAAILARMGLDEWHAEQTAAGLSIALPRGEPVCVRQLGAFWLEASHRFARGLVCFADGGCGLELSAASSAAEVLYHATGGVRWSLLESLPVAAAEPAAGVKRRRPNDIDWI